MHKPIAPRHEAAAKHDMRYLKHDLEAGLCYTTRGPLSIEGHSDSDYATDPDTRRSVSGMLILASGQLITWSSSRQATMTREEWHSSTETEYVAADSATRHMVWLLQLAKEVGIQLTTRPRTLRISDKPAARYYDGQVVPDDRPEAQLRKDNTGALALTHARGPAARTKHLEVRHHYMQQVVYQGTLQLSHVDTSNQLADPFIKPLSRVKYTTFARLLSFA